MPLRKVLIFIMLITFTAKAHSQQQTADIGLFGGGGIPITDYSQMNLFQSVNLAYGIFYRYNFNSRFALRVNANYGAISATGELNSFPQSFRKNVFDLNMILEVNYHDFILGVKEMNFSPFVFTGFGLAFYPGVNGMPVTSPYIPIGVGVKYALTKRLAIGAEASLKKLTNDELDNLDNPYREVGLGKVSDLVHNNDWISHFGLTLTYKFFIGTKPCPAYHTIN
jgi:hypothetical protein